MLTKLMFSSFNYDPFIADTFSRVKNSRKFGKLILM